MSVCTPTYFLLPSARWYFLVITEGTKEARDAENTVEAYQPPKGSADVDTY